jgi:hypothetical protein
MFWKPALWRDVARKWGGICFFYLLLLLVITWAATMGKSYPSFKKFVRDDMPKITEQVPTIDIKNGVVTTNAEEPHQIVNPENGEVFAIIDTTGETKEPPPNAPSMLLTRNKLMSRNAANKIEIHDLSQVQQFHFDGPELQSKAQSALALYWPVLLPALLLVSICWNLIWMLIYAVIGQMAGGSVRPPLTFGALMRLAAIAITPGILIDTVLWLTSLSPGCFWSLTKIGLEIAFMVFMVKSNEDKRQWYMSGGPGVGAGGFPPPPAGMPPGYFPPQPPQAPQPPYGYRPTGQ